MKKKVILIIICIILLSGLAFISWKISNNKKTKKVSLFTEIKENISLKKDMLLFVNRDDEECFLCESAEYILQYYEDIYQLDIIKVNKSNLKNQEYQNILNYVDERKDYITAPALILIKEGQEVAVANEIAMEHDVKTFLSQYGFIDLSKDVEQQIDDTKFDELYNQDGKNLILVNSNSKTGIECRKDMFQLSQKHDFQYYTMIYGMANSNSGYRKAIKKYKKNISPPFLVVVGNKQIIDLFEYNKKEDIKEFLKRNKFI